MLPSQTFTPEQTPASLTTSNAISSLLLPSSNIWSPQRSIKRESDFKEDTPTATGNAPMPLFMFGRGGNGTGSNAPSPMHSSRHSTNEQLQRALTDSDAAYRTAVYASAALSHAHTASASSIDAKLQRQQLHALSLLQAPPPMHAPPPDSDSRPECRECTLSFGSFSSLADHNETAHALFTCRTCYATLTSRSNLDRHARLHSGHRPYACTICQKVSTKFCI